MRPARVERAEVGEQRARLGEGRRRRRGQERHAVRRRRRPRARARARGRRGRRWRSRAAGRRASAPSSPRVQSRKHQPGAIRPARPRRCSASARVTRSVTSRVMPEPGSKRARRARPASTTTRTSGMVSEVSAIAVASTSLRPGGERRERGALRGRRAGRRAAAGATTPGGRRGARRAAVRAISAWPGRKTSTPPSVSARARERRGRRPPPRAAAPARAAGPGAVEPAGLDRPGAALGGDDRRAAHQRGDRGGVEGRRHDEEAQVGAQRAADLERQRQAEVGLQRALVELVEDHAADAGELGRRTGSSGSGCPRSPPRSGCPAPPRRGCGSRPGRPTGSPSASASRSAAARAATRRGSSMRMRPGDACARAGRAARGWSCRRRAAPAARRGRRRASAAAERRQDRLDRQRGHRRRAQPRRSSTAWPKLGRVSMRSSRPTPSPLRGRPAGRGTRAGSTCCAPRPRRGRRCRRRSMRRRRPPPACRAAAASGASRRRRRRVVSQTRRAARSRSSREAGGDRVERAALLRPDRAPCLRGGSTETLTGAPPFQSISAVRGRRAATSSGARSARARRCRRRRRCRRLAVEEEVERSMPTTPAASMRLAAV